MGYRQDDTNDVKQEVSIQQHTQFDSASNIRNGERKMMKRITAVIIELIPVLSVISALLLLKRDADSPFLRIITMIVFIFAFFGFVAFFIGRKLAREDKAVKILGVLDWISTAIIVGIYVLAFFVMAIW
jgi:hypothetical protein